MGGAAGFALVGQLLRKSFGEKRVKRSLHPFAATAIGLAAFLDKEAGFALSERLSRHSGVFREASVRHRLRSTGWPWKFCSEPGPSTVAYAPERFRRDSTEGTRAIKASKRAIYPPACGVRRT